VVSTCGLRRCKASSSKSTAWPDWLPQLHDYTLETTANAGAYKTYRAFGLGEHPAWNRLQINNQSDYLYPVLGCVLHQLSPDIGGITADQIRQLSVRAIPSLHGMSNWLNQRLSQRAEIKAITDLLRANEDPELREIEFFESILDRTNQNQLGVCRQPKPASSNIISFAKSMRDDDTRKGPRRSSRLARANRRYGHR